MKFLLVDTAFDTGLAAIVHDGKIVSERALPLFSNQSRFLFPEIQAMIKESGLQLDSLDFIAAGIGPGSYTGMRVGAMIGKCFAYALKMPLVGVCSMAAFSPVNDGPFTVMVDARISGAYLLKGVKEKGKLHFEKPEVLTIEGAKSQARGEFITLPGNRIMQRIPSDWLEKHPSAEILASQALDLYGMGEFHTDAKLDLLYLRATQAELERK